MTYNSVSANDNQGEQTPSLTFWLTGLSGSGKSTIANAFAHALRIRNINCCVLDGDTLRSGINKDLGFSHQDRAESVRRAAELAKIVNHLGIVSIVSLISPFLVDRLNARKIVGEHYFNEVYLSTPLAICEQRDTKGLYKAARGGNIPNFTGISSPYEAPVHPDISIDTSYQPIEESIAVLLKKFYSQH